MSIPSGEPTFWQIASSSVRSGVVMLCEGMPYAARFFPRRPWRQRPTASIADMALRARPHFAPLGLMDLAGDLIALPVDGDLDGRRRRSGLKLDRYEPHPLRRQGGLDRYGNAEAERSERRVELG